MTKATTTSGRAAALFLLVTALACMRITSAAAELVEETGTNVLRGTARMTGNDAIAQGLHDDPNGSSDVEEDDYDDANSGRNDENVSTTTPPDDSPPLYDGSVEVVTEGVDNTELQKCLQRRDLEEVFGLSEGVICTCIGMAPIDFSGSGSESNRQGDDDNSTPEENNESPVQVEIVVQLTCTDFKSRFNTNSAGQFQYCIPKDDYCNVDSASFCCGNRYCDLQRSQCVAPASSTSLRNGVTDLRLGAPSKIYTHRDDPDREKPESTFMRGQQRSGNGGP